MVGIEQDIGMRNFFVRCISFSSARNVLRVVGHPKKYTGPMLQNRTGRTNSPEVT